MKRFSATSAQFIGRMKLTENKFCQLLPQKPFPLQPEKYHAD